MSVTKQSMGVMLAAALMAGAALADESETDRAKMDAYLASDAFAKRLADGMADATPDSPFVPCPTFTAKDKRILIVKPVRFDDDGVPNDGVWKAETQLEGCGKTKQFNLYFIGRKDPEDARKGKVFFLRAVPGTARGDFFLQRDAVRYAFMGARIKIGKCEKIDIIDTRFDGLKQGKGMATEAGKAPWSETWRIQGCGHVVDVPLEFVPNAMGTRIDLQVNKVTEVPSGTDAPAPRP